MPIFIGLIVFLFSSLFVHSASAATLYYTNSLNSWDQWANYSWSTLENWWQDSAHTIQAESLPQDGDTVYIDGDIYTGVPAISLAHVYAGHYTTNELFNIVLDGVTSDATFKGVSRLNFGTLNGNVTFYEQGSTRGVINGNAVFMTASSSRLILTGYMGLGRVTGTVTDADGNELDTFILRDNAWFYEGSAATGTMTLYDYAVLNGAFSGPVTFYEFSELHSNYTGNPVFYDESSIDNSAEITGNPIFYDSSYNDMGIINGDPVFYDNSYNYNVVNGNPTFYDSSSNDWEVNGDATFVGDAADNTNTVNGTKTRRYDSSTTTTRNFVTGGPWTVVATAGTVNVSGATYDSGTSFIAQNGASFSPEVAPTLSVASPASDEEVTSWSPSISWGNATTCSYAYGSDPYSSVTCANSGSDIPAPSEGSRTLNIRALNSTGTSTHSVSFTYSPVALPDPEPEAESTPATRKKSTSSRRNRVMSQMAASTNTGSAIQSVTAHPASVSAVNIDVSSDELSAFIARLKALLNSEASIPIATSKTTDSRREIGLSNCPDLSQGDVGECVRSLQSFLNREGYLVASEGPGSPGYETAYFGPVTKAALQKYQSAHSIEPASGFFGPLTRSVVSK